jgi:hypothetical protein
MVAGSGPVFFWSMHNNTIDNVCFDNTYNYSGGTPGLGVIDANPSPTLALGTWQGGSLPNFSTTPSDNFQRANAGWLGVNWSFAEMSTTNFQHFFVLSGNAAVPSNGTLGGVAFWTTPLNLNQSSTITIGNLANGDWLAAVVRYSLAKAGSETFYLALDAGGTIELFAYNAGTWETLSNLGTYSGSVSTIELDASGSSPVTLTVKVNGKQFGSTYSDGTYNFSGTYPGFANYGSASSTIIAWQGSNL